LTIAGVDFDPTAADPRVENIAFAGQYQGERTTTAWFFEPSIQAQYLNGGRWRDTPATFAASMTQGFVAAGPALASATITAGGAISIDAGDVTNTAVTASSGSGAINGGPLRSGANTAAGAAGSTSTGAVDGVAQANAGKVDGHDGPGSAQGNTVSGAVGLNATQGGTVTNQTGPAGAAPQTLGSPERPLPGLVPPDNGRFKTNSDPNSPTLVTTAPRFARGDSTGSEYLIARLGVSTDVHKRLGDGYYERQLVLDQLLQLTGRRSLGGDPLSQYRTLMDGAAAEAARQGLPLGAPLTTDQIASLSQDIVWLVEQVVNGEKVLVPVVYLSKATAQRLASGGALIDGDKLSINSTGTLRNDGTLSGSKGAWLSADTLINDGAIRSAGQVGINTQRDTVNRGELAGHSVVINAGGDVVNTVKFDGINPSVGKIQAGAGGVSVTGGRDVINQGVITSAGHALVTAGRDFAQNAAVTNTAAVAGVKAPAGSLTTGGSALVTAGRDVMLDQSGITVGQHAVINAGRDAKFIASKVDAGGGIAVTAGRDIASETVTDTTTTRQTETVKQGKKKTTTTTATTDERCAAARSRAVAA
jgi:filamentous hemagglutinin